MTATRDLETTLHIAFAKSGLTMHRLALASGTPYASVHRFFAPQHELGNSAPLLCTVAKWMKTLGIIVKGPKR